MLFYLFCMFDDFGRMNHWSRNSAGKSTVKTPILQRSISDGIHPEAPIIPDDGGSQKGDLGGARGAHTTWWRGWTPQRASRGCGGPSPPGSTLFRVLLPLVTLRHRESSMKSFAASTGRKLAREKSSPAGRNLPGKFFPREGRSSPSSPS